MPSLKLEKLVSHPGVPGAAYVSAAGAWVSSVTQDKGPWQLGFSTDLRTFHPVLEELHEHAVIAAFSGLVVQRAQARLCVDGRSLTQVTLPSGVSSWRLRGDGADGLWLLSAEGLWHRAAHQPTFAARPLEVLPTQLLATAEVTVLRRDQQWWRLVDGALEPVPSLKRVALTALAGLGERLLGVDGEGALYRSLDRGRSFSRVETPLHVLAVAAVDGRLVAAGRGAVLASTDGATFTTVSENAQAEFASVAALARGALVVDARRRLVLSLGEKGQPAALRVAEPAPQPSPPPPPEVQRAEARLAVLEAPLLGERADTLGRLRTEAERGRPRAGVQPHLVYLDALLEAGVPSAGALATLNRLQHGPRFEEALRANREALVGPTLSKAPADALRWRNGFLDFAHVGASQLDELLAYPSAHLLRTLVVSEVDPQPRVDALGLTVRGLKELVLDGLYWAEDDLPRACDWGSLASIWPAVGWVERLRVSGDVRELGELVLPRCERLELVFGTMSEALAKDLGRVQAPAVRALSLAWGQGLGAEVAAPFFRQPWPALEQLELSAPGIDGVLEALSGSPWAARCTNLTLHATCLGDAGAAFLTRERWPSLREVDLRANGLSEAAQQALRGLAPAVHLDRQRPHTQVLWPPDWER